MTADLCSLNHVTEVARKFVVRRWGPPHLYTKVSPTARRIFDHQCKKTFATVSATRRHRQCSKNVPASRPPSIDENGSIRGRLVQWTLI